MPAQTGEGVLARAGIQPKVTKSRPLVSKYAGRRHARVDFAMNKLVKDNLTRRGRGRPKGSVNKVGAAAKDVIAEAAEKLGGAKRLIAWVKEEPANERAFWSSIYPKLLPLQVTGENGGPVRVGVVEWHVVDPEPKA